MSGERMNKYAKTTIQAAIPVALIGALAFGVPYFANEKNEKISFDSSPEITGSVSYSPADAPNSFTVVAGRSTENISPLKAAQSPDSWLNSDKTCRFTPTVGYFEENLATRGDEFLSKKYLYDEAEKTDSIPSDTRVISFDSTSGNLASVYASYAVPNNGSLSQDMNSGDYYRTSSVRAIAKPVILTEDPSNPGDANSKALPVILLNYDCLNSDDYKESEFKQLVKAIKVDFESVHSDTTPVKDDKKSDPAVVDDPSDDIEDGYTVKPKEFENPNDVVDRGRGRGATDDAPVVTDPDPVQVTQPAWKQ